MSFMGKFFTVALLVISISSLDAVPNNILWRGVACPKCITNEISVTWASDGRDCFVFRNPCMMLGANCGRSMKRQPLLRTVAKKRCQSLCRDVCTAEGPPLCATCNNQKRTFGSQCNLDNHICNTGQICDIYRYGEVCESVAK